VEKATLPGIPTATPSVRRGTVLECASSSKELRIISCKLDQDVPSPPPDHLPNSLDGMFDKFKHDVAEVFSL
jgi:hypothetical protein